MRLNYIKLVILIHLTIGLLFTKDLYKQIQNQLIMAQEGDIILIPEGKYFLSRSLWAEQIKNITIKGKGIDKTILSFKNQLEGAEGIKILI